MAVATTLKALREAIAGQLGLLIDTVIDAGSGTTWTINALADKTPDAERMRDAFLYQGSVMRRILSFGYPSNNDVTLARSAAFSPAAAQIYFLLDPDDFNAAINESLKELYFEQRDTISLVADTKVYSLPAAIQRRSQVLAVKWRDISVLTTDPKEEEVNAYRVFEAANACTLQIYDLLRDITTWDIQVYSRQMYQSLASDSATTTCPYPLVFGVAMVKVLHKILNKYGKGINSLFGPKVMIAERDEYKVKNDWLPKFTPREYIEDEQWQGIDSNELFESPSW